TGMRPPGSRWSPAWAGARASWTGGGTGGRRKGRLRDKPISVSRGENALPDGFLVVQLSHEPPPAYPPPPPGRGPHPECGYVELEIQRIQPPAAQLLLEQRGQVDPLRAAGYLQAAVHEIESVADVGPLLIRHRVEGPDLGRPVVYEIKLLSEY